MRNRKLGFVFQDIRFLDGLTVQENILLLAIIGGTVSAMTEARADQLCDVFGISAIRNKYPAEISGGKKQRPQSLLIHGSLALLFFFLSVRLASFPYPMSGKFRRLFTRRPRFRHTGALFRPQEDRFPYAR